LGEKTVTTSKTKNMKFDEMVEKLFCCDCRKRFPGCKPVSLEVEDTQLPDWTANWGKVWMRVRCKKIT